ncbi:hypothetical protein NL676_001742 [Syzygium grande]|nr:hypothetical protein NL676_001742 [Syzygium grande]
MRGSSATANGWLERDGVAAAECAEILRRDERCNSYGWAEEAMKTKIGGSALRRSAAAAAVARLRAAAMVAPVLDCRDGGGTGKEEEETSLMSFGELHFVGWSANRNHPVGSQAILEFTVGEDLVLKDADGFVAWSTQTYGKSVAGVKLTNTGNLVLFDENNTAVWESFNDPKDTLLPGQKLRVGQKLTPSDSTTNMTEPDGQCRCPDGFFTPIDSLNPQFGCSEVVPLSCEDSHFQSFVEVGGTTYLTCSYKADRQSVPDHVTLDEESCKKVCANNCTTKGVHEVKEEKGVYEAEEDYLDQIPGAPRRFNHDDLKAIIEDFNNRLGEGGFGSVYQGTLSNGAKVTTKHPKV